ncbi:MAG TPA: hypothetical protein VFK41_07655 [Nocardioidaceae bacterium]|nr:hypothetical protein [Nocardioidaceae bacterium]
MRLKVASQDASTESVAVDTLPDENGGILSSPLVRAVCGTALVIALWVTFFVAVALGTAPVSDPDTWWHLVMGGKFLDGTSVRDPGAMSYLGTEDWHSRDWGTQLLASQFERWFALPGVAWLFTAGLVVLLVAVYRLARSRAGFAAATLTVFIGLWAAMGSLTPRPQLVSFVLLVVLLGALTRTTDDLKARVWIAPLTGVWACLHGLWFVSPVLQAVVIGGLVLDRRLDARSAGRHVGVVLLSLAAVAVTPNGLALLADPLGPTNSDLSRYVAETSPPSLDSSYFVFALAMLGVIGLTWVRRGVPVDWTRILLLALAAGFCVLMARTVTLGALVAVPLFAEALDHWLKGLRLHVPPRLERAALYGVAAAALVVSAFVVPQRADAPATSLPVALDASLDILPSDAVVLNELSDGGYLAWRHPELRITVDGLSDQYAASYLAEVYATGELGPGWQEFVAGVGATHALLFQGSPLAEALRLQGWTVQAESPARLLLESP